MNDESKATFIKSQIACALIEMEGMRALNMQREAVGQSMAYIDTDFFALIDKYGIGHNTVVGFLNQ